MSVDKHEDKDNKKEDLKEELRDRHEDEDRHYDVNKIHKKKDELKDNIVDNFNFWINVAFITLGVLLLLTVILLFYSIFSGSSINKTPITTSTTNESSIPIPKNTSWFSTPKPVVNTPLPPVIEKVSDTTSWFSTPKVVITDTKIPKTVNTLLSEIKVGKSCRVVAIKDTSTLFLQYLIKLSINIGTKISVLEKIPYDNSLQIQIGNEQITNVSAKFSESILVA